MHAYKTYTQQSGYYIIESNNPTIPELVYCNLTKKLFDSNIQINYGAINIGKENVWFEVVKDNYNGCYGQGNRKIDFSKININVGNAIDNITKQFTAPIEEWYQFFTSGRAYYYNSYIRIDTIRNTGLTENEYMYKGEAYGNHKDSFLTTMFTRYLEVGERIVIREYGYKFPAVPPFRFVGYSVPNA